MLIKCCSKGVNKGGYIWYDIHSYGVWILYISYKGWVPEYIFLFSYFEIRMKWEDTRNVVHLMANGGHCRANPELFSSNSQAKLFSKITQLHDIKTILIIICLRRDMETPSTLLALSGGKPSATVGFPSYTAMTFLLESFWLNNQVAFISDASVLMRRHCIDFCWEI